MMIIILPNDIHSFGPIYVNLGWNLVTVNAITHDRHYFHAHVAIQWLFVSCMEVSTFVIVFSRSYSGFFFLLDFITYLGLHMVYTNEKTFPDVFD